MKFFVEDSIAQPDKEIYFRVREAVLRLPDDIDDAVVLGERDDGQLVRLSCHILARAVAKVYGLKYQDGYFCTYYGPYQHGWVITPNNNVIDVYPVGILGGPFIVDALVAHYLYVLPEVIKRDFPKLNSICTRIVEFDNFSKPWFCEAVKIVTQMLREIKQ